MTYPDTILITVPTVTGAEDEFGQKTAGTPTTIYNDVCEVNDKTYEENRRISGSGSLVAYASVMLPTWFSILTVNLDAQVVIQMNDGAQRLGVVVGVTVLGNILGVRLL